MWSQPLRPLWIPGQSRDVTRNWVYVEVAQPFLLAVVLRHRLQAGAFLGHPQLFHSGCDLLQVPLCGRMPRKVLSFVFSGIWRFGDVQHTGALNVL